jgi:DNA-binding SARP family transcriptional activator/Tfp pilus assembly protein PilF
VAVFQTDWPVAGEDRAGSDPPAPGEVPIRFRLLGPVQVETDDGPVVPGRRQERYLLAILLLECGRLVTMRRLCELLWDDAPPELAPQAVRSLVSRLRALLARVGVDPQVALVSKRHGYVLSVAPQTVDAYRFRSLVDRAGRAGDLAERDDLLRDALALWRGPALHDAVPEGLRQRLCADLEELRLGAIEESIATGLARGRDRELLPELAHLAAELPVRDRLAEMHMLALYRLGRVTEALDVFQRARARLADELGLDPSHALQQLHQTILRGEPPPPAMAGLASGSPETYLPQCLPRDISDFTGREEQLAGLLAAVPESPILTIDGMPGVGKTALAVHLAHHLAHRYPDGQLAIDLHGHSERAPMDPAAALDVLLRQLGVAGDRIPDGLDARVALWRSKVAGRRVLLLLDNAATSEQIDPLLPAAAGCLTLVTSRRRLIGLGGGRSFALDVLTPEESVALLHRVAGERVLADPQSAVEVARRCGYLTLAVRLAAARLAHRPSWTVQDLAERLGHSQHALHGMAAEGRTVSGAFGLSYAHLSDCGQRVFRLLGLNPGPDIELNAAAHLAGLPLDDADTVLGELVDAHLVDEPVAGRYRLHDLTKEYAATLTAAADPEPDRRSSIERMLDYYVHAAVAAVAPFDSRRRATFNYRLDVVPPPDLPKYTLDSAAAWFGQERQNLVAAVGTAVDGGWNRHAWRLARATWPFLYRNGYHDDAIRTLRLALDAAQRDGDREAAAAMHNYIAANLHGQGNWDEALEHVDRAIEIRESLGDGMGWCVSVVNRGRVLVACGRYREALAAHREALRIGLEYEAPAAVIADCHTNIGWVATSLGDYAVATESFQRHLDIAEAAGSAMERGAAYAHFGYLALRQGNHAAAIDLFQKALPLRAGDDPSAVAEDMCLLGTAYRGLGDLTQARQHQKDALAATERSADVYIECKVRIELAATLHIAGEDDAALHHLREALAIADRVRLPPERARALDGLADVIEATDPVAAKDAREQAEAIFEDLGLPRPPRD